MNETLTIHEERLDALERSSVADQKAVDAMRVALAKTNTRIDETLASMNTLGERVGKMGDLLQGIVSSVEKTYNDLNGRMTTMEQYTAETRTTIEHTIKAHNQLGEQVDQDHKALNAMGTAKLWDRVDQLVKDFRELDDLLEAQIKRITTMENHARIVLGDLGGGTEDPRAQVRWMDEGPGSITQRQLTIIEKLLESYTDLVERPVR